MVDSTLTAGCVVQVNTSRTSDTREKVKKRRGTATKKRSNNNKNSPSVLEAQAVPSYGCK